MRKFLPVLLCLLLAACNMPTSESDAELNDQAATIVALTLNAQSSTVTSTTSTSTPARANTPLPSPTLAITGTPTPTITPTYSVPMITVNETTNCRSGPGQTFDILVSLLPGAKVEIVGRYPTNNYWVVKAQDMDEPCWLWGEYSTTSGSYWAVPSVTPPPTKAPRPAGQPTNLTYTYGCTFNGVNSDVAVTLKWSDQSDDELGYRVFRDNAQIVELPANSRTYSEVVAAAATQTLTYSVAAFNAIGESGRATISFSCQ